MSDQAGAGGAVSIPIRARLRVWRLGRRTRRAVLIAHIVAAGAWIGIDAVLLGRGTPLLEAGRRPPDLELIDCQPSPPAPS